jgi:hypothetical protein
VDGRVNGSAGVVECAFVVTSGGRASRTGFVAVVTDGRCQGTHGRRRVEERDQHALFHELVDFVDSLVQRRRVRRDVRVGEVEQRVTYIGRQVDLVSLANMQPTEWVGGMLTSRGPDSRM